MNMNHHTLEYKLTLPLSNRLINAKELSIRIGKSVAWIYKYQSAGLFPKGVKINSRNILWDGNEIQDWIEGVKSNKKGF